MGKGKKLRDEDDLLKYLRENPKSVEWRDLEWLLEYQGWIRQAEGRRGSDWVYEHPSLKALDRRTKIEGQPMGEREPIEKITVTRPHPGNIMIDRCVKRILPKLEMVARLRKDEKNCNDKQDI